MRDHDALIRFLADRRQMPFAWGRNDCVRFAFDAVEAQTGRDLAAEIGATWSDKASATRELRRLGGLERAISRVLAPIPPAMAHRGDLGLVTVAEGPCLMIVEGATLVGVDQVGLGRLPRALMSCAWSIEPS